MEEVVGKRAPGTLRADSKWLSWAKAGVDLLFDVESKNSKYPPVPKGKSFIPYLTALNPTKRFAWTLPYGVTAKWEPARLEALFGPPSIHTHQTSQSRRWHVPLIVERDIVMSIYEDGPVYLRIKTDDETLATAP